MSADFATSNRIASNLAAQEAQKQASAPTGLVSDEGRKRLMDQAAAMKQFNDGSLDRAKAFQTGVAERKELERLATRDLNTARRADSLARANMVNVRDQLRNGRAMDSDNIEKAQEHLANSFAGLGSTVNVDKRIEHFRNRRKRSPYVYAN